MVNAGVGFPAPHFGEPPGFPPKLLLRAALAYVQVPLGRVTVHCHYGSCRNSVHRHLKNIPTGRCPRNRPQSVQRASTGCDCMTPRWGLTLMAPAACPVWLQVALAAALPSSLHLGAPGGHWDGRRKASPHEG